MKTEEKVEKSEEAVEEKKTEEPQDLTKVEGIGPKTAEALVAKGITSFAELAETSADQIKEILAEASSSLVHLDPTSWPKQAKMAADGQWDELKEWQDSVKGGVE